MKLHNLKIKDEYFSEVVQGKKKAELRKNDRRYNKDDLIHFINIYGDDFFGCDDNLYIITHVLENVSDYGLKDGYCILSIERLK